MVIGENMNIKKTFSKAMLMAMSLVALTACGNNDSNTTTDNKTETTQSAENKTEDADKKDCLLYTSPSPRDATLSRMPSSA